MKKILFFISVFCIWNFSNSQSINVNTSTYTVPQLVENILFGSQNSGTGVISNITWSTGTNFGSSNGIGYFTNTNNAFPINSGLLLSTGLVTAAAGPNTTTQSNGSDTWAGDTQLFNYIDGLGIDPGLLSYNNASVIEFDFIPLINHMSFNFVFASDEYGTFQCDYSDAFAFFLTNTTAGTPTTNLAMIPNTNMPISVVTIRDSANNSGCTSENVQYFGNYSSPPSSAANASATNFNGSTISMVAESNVIPNHTYHIKLVIADRNDNMYDSAVFLSQGSFYLGQQLKGAYGTTYENFNDFTVANGGALCNNETRRINLGMVPITGTTYEWYKDNVLIAGANSYFYDVADAGQYTVKMKFANNNYISDSFVVENFPAIVNPEDLTSSNLVFDLTQNVPVMLNGQNNSNYNVTFYATLADAESQINPILNPNNYYGSDGQMIYASVTNLASQAGCSEVKSFTLRESLSSNSISNSFNFTYQPNPINDILHLSATTKITTIDIISVLGQKLFSNIFNQNDILIDLSNYATGTYLLKANSETGSKTVKIVKN